MNKLQKYKKSKKSEKYISFEVLVLLGRWIEMSFCQDFMDSKVL